MKKLLFVFGTRPETIKVIPVIQQLRSEGKCKKEFAVRICVTAQHREMLDQILNAFKLRSDYDLDIMAKGQSLYDITTRTLSGLERLLSREKFDMVLVHGDTTTTFSAALAAFYGRIPVAHIEAGLRSYDKANPYPEELNRLLTDGICDLLFAPTARAGEALLKENIPRDKIYVTGNTVIDALHSALQIKHEFRDKTLRGIFRAPNPGSGILLVTAHRRENFGAPIENICGALKRLAGKYPSVRIIYPVHMNPNIHEPVHRILGGVGGIHLIPPLDYLDFINLIKRARIVITDSGGLQEEAPSLGKPVLVLRKVTERPEGVKTGTVRLVGTEKERIVREVSALLDDRKRYLGMSCAVNPYGDGKAKERIAEIIRYYFGLRHTRPKDFKVGDKL
jgi:UDP-N-acetylglucosamine 2-epimerase (non-hydrolysing)